MPSSVRAGCSTPTAGSWWCTNVLGAARAPADQAAWLPTVSRTGPAGPDHHRDQAEVEARVADHLGVERFAAVIGGSMGGMRALEWLVMYPDRVRSAVLPGHRRSRVGGSDRHPDRADPCDHQRPGLGRRRLLRRSASHPRPRRGTAICAPHLPHCRGTGPPIRTDAQPGSSPTGRRLPGATNKRVGMRCSRTSTTTRTSWPTGSTQGPTSP